MVQKPTSFKGHTLSAYSKNEQQQTFGKSNPKGNLKDYLNKSISIESQISQKLANKEDLSRNAL